MKHGIVYLLAFAVFAGLIFGCGIFSERFEKAETENITLYTGERRTLNLDNINGKIELNQSSDSGLIRIVARKEISVRKKDLDKPFDEITIKIDSTLDEIRIDSEINKRSGTKFFNIGNIKGPKVDYTIFIPANHRIRISNVNGDITAGSLNADLKIEIVNGNVDIENFSGLFESETTNGEVSLGVDSTTGIDIETVNGSVDLAFGENISASLKAETQNGKISDEGLDLKNVKREKKYLKADLGSGASTSISLSTINGRIALKGKNKNWQ